MLATAALLHAGGLRAQELPFTHYGTTSEVNPLPRPAVTDVLQDRQGYLWLANHGAGLVRYDGSTMELFAEADGLTDAGLFGLLQDPTGRLWAYTGDHGLFVSEEPLQAYAAGRRVRFTRQVGDVKLYTGAVDVFEILVTLDQRGWVWAGTSDSGIIRYRPGPSGGLVADTIRTGDPNVAVTSLFGRKDGTVWAILKDRSIMVFGEQATPVRTLGAATLPCPGGIKYEDAAGALYGTCGRGTPWRLDGPPGQERLVSATEPLGGDATAMIEVRPGVLWVAGIALGIAEYDMATLRRTATYGRERGLPEVNLWSVAQDREGNIWIGRNNGLSKLRADFEAFRHVTGRSHAGERPLLPAADVMAVVPEMPVPGAGGVPSTALAVGTSEGLALLRGDGQTHHLTLAEGLPDAVILGLSLDAAGDLWIGTRAGTGRLSFRPGRHGEPGAPSRTLTVFGRPATLTVFPTGQTTSLRSITLPSGRTGATHDALCLAGPLRLACRVGERWFRFGREAGLPEHAFWTVEADRQGYLYVGTASDGLYRSTRPLSLALLDSLEGTVLDRPVPGARQVTAPLFAPAKDASGRRLLTGSVPGLVRQGDRLWACSGDTLVAFETGALRVAGRLTDSLGTGLFSLALAPGTERLWVGSNDGLYEVDPRTLRVLRHVTQDDGLAGNETWGTSAVAASRDGTVYHGSALGLTVYRPALDRPNTTPPLIEARQFAYTEDGWGANDLTLRYAALAFGNEKRVRYRTRLVGYDAGWSAETTATSTRYTNLRAVFLPRRYVFEVLAANDEGTWTKTPFRQAVLVHPALWLRWWAFGLYALVLAAALLGVDRVQRRRLVRQERERARERELEQAREIERAYHELEQTHAHLQATQARLVQQEKLASLGQLTAGIAHEIKNPLNFVNNFALNSIDLADELDQTLGAHAEARREVEELVSDLKLNARKIAEHGRRADGIVRSMLDHARTAAGDRQPTDLHALLDEYVGLACDGARTQRPDFTVQVERDYDPALGRVELVPQEMGRVFLNLFGNALYAVAEQQAAQGAAYRPVVTVRTREVDGQAEIQVHDNGPGIPDRIRQRIFEPFFTTKPAGQGTGLGLSLSYDIVTQRHGGRLDVESRPGHGTTFIVSLPLHPAPARPVDVDPPQTQRALPAS